MSHFNIAFKIQEQLKKRLKITITLKLGFEKKIFKRLS